MVFHGLGIAEKHHHSVSGKPFQRPTVFKDNRPHDMVQVTPDGSKNFFEDLRVEEKRGPQVKAMPITSPVIG